MGGGILHRCDCSQFDKLYICGLELFYACILNRKELKYMNEIIKLLTENGIVAEATTVTKNGVTRNGIKISTGTICPVIYPDTDMTTGEILELIDEALINIPAIDVAKIVNPEFIYANCRYILGRPDENAYVFGDCLDTKMYGYVTIDDTSGYRLTEDMVSSLNLCALCKALDKNTKDSFIITDIVDALISLGGLSKEFADIAPRGEQFIVSNLDNKYGAAALMYPDVFRKFCLEQGKDECYIIPSSIHELIVTFNNVLGSGDIQEVNNTSVIPEEQLGDHPYRYNLAINKITLI